MILYWVRLGIAYVCVIYLKWWGILYNTFVQDRHRICWIKYLMISTQYFVLGTLTLNLTMKPLTVTNTVGKFGKMFDHYFHFL